jgi:hypothetical protein
VRRELTKIPNGALTAVAVVPQTVKVFTVQIIITSWQWTESIVSYTRVVLGLLVDQVLDGVHKGQAIFIGLRSIQIKRLRAVLFVDILFGIVIAAMRIHVSKANGIVSVDHLNSGIETHSAATSW